MRGRGIESRNSRSADGITPAYAGKRELRHAFGLRAEDHPRVCGEELTDEKEIYAMEGSPPRARGRDGHPGGYRHHGRITPACAGKRNCQCRRMAPEWDHPRMRGEEFWPSTMTGFRLGSPPRARGRGCHHGVRARGPGITPACAGKSGHPWCGFAACRDHPRACGEEWRLPPSLPRI